MRHRNTIYCSSVSYVDDLVLTANSPENLQRLIDIVSNWCKQNFFQINTTKDGTGILHVGPRDSYHDFHIDGLKLTTLNTKENFPSFRYLGFYLRPDEKWNDFLETTS